MKKIKSLFVVSIISTFVLVSTACFATGYDFSVNKNTVLWKYIASLPVVDTHEHMSDESELLGLHIDFFSFLTPYVIDNIETAGLTVDERAIMLNPQHPFEERWKVFNKYYSDIQHTTYMHVLRKSLEYEYQLKSFSLAEVKRVSDLILKDFSAKGFVKRTMDNLKIESILTFRSAGIQEVRRSYGNDNIKTVPTVNDICVTDAYSLKKISELTEMPVQTIDDILRGIDKLFIEYQKQGLKNIKINAAYNRRLNYRERTRREAEESFGTIMNTPFDYGTIIPNKYYVYTLSDYHLPLDDYLTVYMIQQAAKYGMNVIFHVGPAAWNFNSTLRSHTSDLEWLFKNFPKVNFVVLHAGYPYFDEAMLYAKYYPNVYLNMTWDHILEREKAIEAMIAYIEMLPITKIHLFGGDYVFPQQIYGHLMITKENLYIALNYLIKKGTLDLNQAKDIAVAWLYRNPDQFYF